MRARPACALDLEPIGSYARGAEGFHERTGRRATARAQDRAGPAGRPRGLPARRLRGRERGRHRARGGGQQGHALQLLRRQADAVHGGRARRVPSPVRPDPLRHRPRGARARSAHRDRPPHPVVHVLRPRAADLPHVRGRVRALPRARPAVLGDRPRGGAQSHRGVSRRRHRARRDRGDRGPRLRRRAVLRAVQGGSVPAHDVRHAAARPRRPSASAWSRARSRCSSRATARRAGDARHGARRSEARGAARA